MILHRRTAIITSDQGLRIDNKTLKIGNIWRSETFNFSVTTTFYHQFCLCRDFLVPPANFLRCSHITWTHQNFCPFFLLKYITPALSSGFTRGLTGHQRWQNVPLNDIEGSFSIKFNTGMDEPLDVEPRRSYLTPNKDGDWGWAWWVHQQFNLLKAVSAAPWIIFNLPTTLSHDINQ